MTRTALVAYSVVLIGIGAYAGWYLRSDRPQSKDVTTGAPASQFVCAMNCVDPVDQPGDCPVCGMALTQSSNVIPPQAHDKGLVTLSEEARQRAGIELYTVKRKFVPMRVRLLGTIQVDETRMTEVASWTNGRIVSTYGTKTGATIRQGQPLVSLDAPVLAGARSELEGLIRAQSPALLEKRVEAVRERLSLRLWGMEESQLEKMIESKSVPDVIVFSAPCDGIIMECLVTAGTQVMERAPLIRIANLEKVTAEFKLAPEYLQWIREGQAVQVTVEDIDTAPLTGTIDDIDSTLSPAGMGRIEVSLDNAQNMLRPGLPVTGEVLSYRTANGNVLDPGEEPNAQRTERKPLVIPASAPLLTGRRAVVYIAQSQASYEPREVRLGPRSGEYFIVEEGLAEGEEVVVNGAMRLDGEAQLTSGAGLLGIMQHDHRLKPDPEDAQAAPREWGAFVRGYLAMQDALAHDRFEDAGKHAKELLDAVPAGTQSPLAAMRVTVEAILKSGSMEGRRKLFHALSDQMIKGVSKFGTGQLPRIYRVHCPMAFDDTGADWLQTTADVTNPYFGAAMYRCGLVKETIESGGNEKTPD